MKDLGWANALIVSAVILVAGVMAIVPAFTRPRRNKHTGLPAPRPDERNSIEQFKRIVQ